MAKLSSDLKLPSSYPWPCLLYLKDTKMKSVCGPRVVNPLVTGNITDRSLEGLRLSFEYRPTEGIKVMLYIILATPGDHSVRFRIYQKSIPLIFNCFILILKYVQFLWNWYDWKVNKLNFVLVWVLFSLWHRKNVFWSVKVNTHRESRDRRALRDERLARLWRVRSTWNAEVK